MFTKSTRLLFVLWLLILMIVGGYYACSDDGGTTRKDATVDGTQVIDGTQSDVGQDMAGDGFFDAISTDAAPAADSAGTDSAGTD